MQVKRDEWQIMEEENKSMEKCGKELGKCRKRQQRVLGGLLPSTLLTGLPICKLWLGGRWVKLKKEGNHG